MMSESIQAALEKDELIDITTTGRKSGRPQRVEIWFRRVEGKIYITGTPGPRDWYANLLADPNFTFHLKVSAVADLAVKARPVTEIADRQAILSDSSMSWFHNQGYSFEDLVNFHFR